MSDFRVSGQRGTNIGFLVAITLKDANGVPQPVDLTAAGTKVVVTGKLRTDDAVPVFTKDYWQVGGAPHGGVTVWSGDASHKTADVELLPADTNAITKTSYVLVDVVLTDAAGKVTRVASGVVKVRVGPGT